MATDITTTWGVDYTQATSGLSKARREMLREVNSVDREMQAASRRIASNFSAIGTGVFGAGSGAVVYAQMAKAVDVYTKSVGRATDATVTWERATRSVYESFGRNISQGMQGFTGGTAGAAGTRGPIDQFYDLATGIMRSRAGYIVSPVGGLIAGSGQYSGVPGESMDDLRAAFRGDEEQSRKFARDQMMRGLTGRLNATGQQAQGDVAASARTRLQAEFAQRRSAAADQFAASPEELSRELAKLNVEQKAASQELELQLSIRQRMLDLEIKGYEFEQQSAAAARLKTEYREKAAILAEADVRLAREFAAIEARSDITLDQKNERKAQAARANVETTNASVAALEKQQKLRDRDISNSIQDSSREAEIQVKKLTNREGEAELDAQRLEYFRRVREAQQDEELRVRNPELYKQRIDSIRAEAAQVIPATAAELARSSRYQLRAIEAGLPTRGAFGASPGQNSFGMFGIGSVNGSGQSGPDEQLIRTIDGLKAALQAATDALKNNGGLGP